MSPPVGNAIFIPSAERRPKASVCPSAPRFSQLPHEEGLLLASLVLRSLTDLHQPARGERQAPPPPGRVPDCAFDLRAIEGGGLCAEGVHGEEVGDGVSVAIRAAGFIL